MIEIPALTPEILEELGQELGGCDFTSVNQQSFLSAAQSRDIQAAPGNGKTTLLVAKLALLSRSWTSRTKGVCVISHTNAAREEVETKLFTHPSASAFLSYPHFIGTVTAFIDRFIALPYLRGLGWSIQRIDDEAFAAAALSRLGSKPALVRYAQLRNGANRHSLHRFVSNLELAEDFECPVDVSLQRLKVCQMDRQPGPQSQTGAALEELKADLVNDGIYRFADMTALAFQAIERCPRLIQCLRNRFPLVLLDEAQDTNGAQLTLLDRLFGEEVVYQRLGDENQTLYEDESLTPDDYWQANEGVIPLNATRRFGAELASFVSRLTVRAPQQIEGLPDRPSRRILILFDDFSIGNVLPAYAEQVRAHWGDAIGSEVDIRAVASRHNPTRDSTGGWPKTLIDYCPNYRSQGGRQHRAHRFCIPSRQASILHDTHSAPAEVAELIKFGLVSLVRCQGILDADGKFVSRRNLWSVLEATDPGVVLKIKRLVRDQIVFGIAAWEAEPWHSFCTELITLMQLNGILTEEARAFLEFVQHAEGEEAPPQEQVSRTVFLHDGIRIKLGSIHAVKGKTVDSILVVETEVYRGRALDQRAMDLETVLPHAFGIEDRNFIGNPAQLSAATNIFVAATRTRHFLCFALRSVAASQELRRVAEAQGWLIRDLTAAET